MLEPYQALLERLRADPAAWTECAFVRAPREKQELYDRRSLPRLGALLCLQYDRRDADHPLTRYLFEQEVGPARLAPFQGVPESLLLGTFLLARYRDPADVELFWKAREANFDTACGFPAEFLRICERGTRDPEQRLPGRRRRLPRSLADGLDACDDPHLAE